MTKFTLLLIILAGLNSCIGNVLLKMSRKSLAADAGFITQFSNWLFISGMGFYAVNVFLFAKALDSAPVSVAYPILATSSFAMLAMASVVLFGESLSILKVAGLGYHRYHNA